MEKTPSNNEFLILHDQEGNYFAIPRETVESFRLTGEKQAELESALGEDVMGYMMDNWYVRENLTAQYQAERREEAARERLLRTASDSPEGPEPSGGDTSTQPGGLRGLLVGMFAILRSSPSGTAR